MDAAAAGEMVNPGAHLCQRLLGGVLGVLRIGEQVVREPPDGRLVTLAQHFERPPVAVTRPHGQHDVRHGRVPRALTYAISQRQTRRRAFRLREHAGLF